MVMTSERRRRMFMVAAMCGAYCAVLGCGAARGRGGESSNQKAASAAPLAEKRLELERAQINGAAAPAPILMEMQRELRRSMQELGRRAKPVPYYLSYQVVDGRSIDIDASLGGLVGSNDARIRSLVVDTRVGTPELDNTRLLKGEDNQPRFFATLAWLPLEDDPAAIGSILWLQTHKDYERAAEDLIRVRANSEIKVGGEDSSADFSHEKPASHSESPASLAANRPKWEERVERYSALFIKHPDIHGSSVDFSSSAATRYFVNSEGSTIQTARTDARFTISAFTTAGDGMNLERVETLDARSAEKLPGDSEVSAAVEKVIYDLLALRKAPPIDPFAGPAILDGKAAAVFFHEVFGHRVEGHRQKNEEEGQTFTRKIGEMIMPDFLDVYDDPTVSKLNGIDLNGHYSFDDEGVAGSKTALVENGILRGFLMSRSPIRGFAHSNGHGRRQAGFRAVARQGNLIVDPSRTTTPSGLKQLLIEEVQRQKKPFGLRFTEITGGYTNTTRYAAQAFKVLPVMVYKVYSDGREELVRGVDLEGTPLTVLSRILAAANDFQVFNGMCGAESGWVPVSAVSPSLLVSQIEVARREKEQDRPPLLPAPAAESTAVKKGGR